uniref:Small integral membrane protein 3 n=2 Tax=Falco TaxID=8952 RepID=A0A8C4UTW0_FALTI
MCMGRGPRPPLPGPAAGRRPPEAPGGPRCGAHPLRGKAAPHGSSHRWCACLSQSQPEFPRLTGVRSQSSARHRPFPHPRPITPLHGSTAEPPYQPIARHRRVSGSRATQPMRAERATSRPVPPGPPARRGPAAVTSCETHSRERSSLQYRQKYSCDSGALISFSPRTRMDFSDSASPAALPKHILDIWVIVLIILATILIMTALVLCPATAVIIYRVRTHPMRNGIV